MKRQGAVADTYHYGKGDDLLTLVHGGVPLCSSMIWRLWPIVKALADKEESLCLLIRRY